MGLIFGGLFVFVWGLAMADLTEKTQEIHEFGRAAREYFALADGFTNLNHGSFGSTPLRVLQGQYKHQLEAEAYPDVWFRKTYRDIWRSASHMLAEYIDADQDEVVIVENASSGVNAVLRSIADEQSWGKDDGILILDLAYPMVKNTAEYLEQHRGIQILVVPVSEELELNITSRGVVDVVSSFLQVYAHSTKLRMAVFSHITSVPGFTLPMEMLSTLFHGYDIPVFVDGAHALGQRALSFRSQDADSLPDFYVGNAHKWLYSPKGTALLWVTKKWHRFIFPTVISSEVKANMLFQERFVYVGTRLVKFEGTNSFIHLYFIIIPKHDLIIVIIEMNSS